MSIAHELRQLTALEEKRPDIVGLRDPYPHCLEIHPTDFCNQACEYCFHGGNGYDAAKDSELLTLQQYETIFDQAQNCGIQEISISGGGEPFFAKDITQILDSLTKTNLIVRIVSHGNHIPQAAIPGILAANEIRFSVDSIVPETYNAIRGLPHSSQMLLRTLGNMADLVEQRNANPNSTLSIGTTFIIGDKNCSEIMDFAEFMIEQVGIDEVIYKYSIYDDHAATAATDTEIRHMLQEAQVKYGTKVSVRDPIDANPAGKPCITPYLKIALNPYGDVFSCCLGSQPGELNGYKFGNIQQTPNFAELWQSSHGTRKRMLGGVACTSCNYADILNNRLFIKEGEYHD